MLLGGDVPKGECREDFALSSGAHGVSPCIFISPFLQEGGDAEGVGIPNSKEVTFRARLVKL